MSDSKTRKAVDKAVSFLYHPTVRKVSRFAASVLETASLVDTKSPFSMAVAALSTVDAAVEAFEFPLPSKIEQWAQSNGYVESFGYIGRLMVASGAVDLSKVKTVCKEQKVALKKIEFDFGSLLYVEDTDTSSHYKDELDRILGYFYVTQDFPFDKLFSRLWDRYNGGIYLSLKVSDEDHSSVRDLKLHHLSTNELFYIGEKPNMDAFVSELQSYRGENISRSYMLAGEPGTGKTSFAIKSSQAIASRILKIDPSVARRMGSGEFEFVITNLRPEAIVFDDFDRAASDESHLLFLLENIKQNFPEIVIFATVNEFDALDDALKRPGRFDQTIWFDLPDPVERAQIAIHYLTKYGAVASDELIEVLVQKTDDMSPAYIKELCMRVGRRGWDVLDATIDEFSRTLKRYSDEEIEEDDEYGEEEY